MYRFLRNSDNIYLTYQPKYVSCLGEVREDRCSTPASTLPPPHLAAYTWHPSTHNYSPPLHITVPLSYYVITGVRPSKHQLGNALPRVKTRAVPGTLKEFRGRVLGSPAVPSWAKTLVVNKRSSIAAPKTRQEP